MKKILCLFALLGLSVAAGADTEVLAHYQFGKVGNITYAAAPSAITDKLSGREIIARGNPVFFADAPAARSRQGGGSILFDGEDDGYVGTPAYGAAQDNMVLEVWAKAKSVGDAAVRCVAANGSGSQGYMIGINNGRWVLVSGSVAVVPIAAVEIDRWTHIAVVHKSAPEKGSHDVEIYLDGEKLAETSRSPAFTPVFSIGSDHNGANNFNGLVHEVRLSTFAEGGFDPDADLLLDYEKIMQVREMRAEERRQKLAALLGDHHGLELVAELPDELQEKDWLIEKIDTPCRLYMRKADDEQSLMMQLNNGLLSRTFLYSENLGCVSYKNLSNDAQYIRAVKPEARVQIDGVWYDVGGLKGQPEKAYLLESWYDLLEPDPQAFTLVGIETGEPTERYPWKQKYNAVEANWPPKGLRMELIFGASESMAAVQDVEVRVCYEIYEGIPVLRKWIEVVNRRGEDIVLDDMECELLAVNQDQLGRLHVESDYSFALANLDPEGSALMHLSHDMPKHQAGRSTTQWKVDPEYTSWASQNAAEDIFLDFQHRNLLVSELPMGPAVAVAPNQPFISFNTFVLLQDSDDRERKSLGHRQMYKKLAPQVTESLIAAAITSHDTRQLKSLIDQMEELGMEKLTIDPWPGLDYSNNDEGYLRHWEEIATYAKERGIIMAGYELQVAAKSRGAAVDCINPATGKPGSAFGQSVCIASKWVDFYYPRMWKFYESTGFMAYTADGPYHGDPCASTTHKYHRGLEDSQWEQWKQQVEVIHEAQRRGMYVALPDWYFLNGCVVTGMGYREDTANLSPQQQMLLGRQYIYDGTWHKLPTMGWMTLQLVGFYTGATHVGLEPLHENIDRYEQQLAQYLASGCQLAIRGYRMYDTPETKAMVLKWLDWFREYREILTSSIVHVSRPTGRDLDCIMHVNPFIDHKGMVIVFNPTERAIKKEFKLPLYYTGLKDRVRVRDESGSEKVFKLNSKQELLLPVEVPAGGRKWFVLMSE